MKTCLTLFIICLVYFITIGQENYIFSVSAIEKPANADDRVYNEIEQLIWQKLSNQNRFPVLDGETNVLKTADNTGVEKTESGQAIPATHLVKIKLLPFNSNVTPVPPGFELLDFKVEGSAELNFEMEIFDVATGTVVVSEKFNGRKGLIKRVSKIPLTKTVWSKENGVQTVKKSKKEFEKDKAEFLKEYKKWKVDMEAKAIESAVTEFDKKFRRLFLPDILIIKIVDESKGKAQKVLISEGAQLAFGNREKIEVVLSTVIEFEGEEIKRDKIIGLLKFIEIDGKNALCKVSDGKEEIYDAFAKGQKLSCIVE